MAPPGSDSERDDEGLCEVVADIKVQMTALETELKNRKFATRQLQHEVDDLKQRYGDSFEASENGDGS